MEYDFRQAYGFSALNPRTVATLAGRIATDPEVGRQYMAFYSVSAAPEITRRDARGLSLCDPERHSRRISNLQPWSTCSHALSTACRPQGDGKARTAALTRTDARAA